MLGEIRRFVVLAFVVVAFMYPTTLAAQEITTCEDFEYQQDAQKFFDQGGGRPQDWYGGMDQDGDGVACESLPGKPFHKQAWFMPTAGLIGAALVVSGVMVLRNRKQEQASSPSVDVQTPEASILPTGHYDSESNQNPHVMIVVNNDSHVQASAKSSAQNTNSTSSDDDSWMTPEKARAMPYAEYLKSRYWQKVRKNNIARANGTCTDCGRRNQVLHVHHLSYEFLGREIDRFLVVLCADCHQKRHDIPSPPSPKMNA